MIQDIHPHRFDNQYLPGKTIGPDDYVLHFTDRSLLLKIDGDNTELPRMCDFFELPATISPIYLFALDGVSCFLVDEPLEPKHPDIRETDISFFRTTQQREVAWMALAGYHLKTWYDHNRFCGKCGTRTQHKPDERALVCSGCQTVVYPKISPAIIVAIVCNDRILLARNTNFPGSWYSLVAGYADVGESLEETVHREVKEEVGIDVKNIRYYTSQPWPLSGSMMVGFVAEADDRQPIVLEEKEIADAQWFDRNNLPDHPSGSISIAGEMIDRFRNGEL